ncbi:MAG: Gfo/Idh/MocA family oxidoreductase [Planctomycetes bacterium]|nr:Gfo/Idh/MocA family oxidoreductase [Planctomycetota bacterium]
MKAVEFGVIGCGGRLRGLTQSLLSNGGLRLRGVWDPEPEHCRMLLDAAKEGKCYASYRELVEDPEISWVLIGSPNACHKEHAVAAFENHKHVFCEKPLATTIEDCVCMNDMHGKSGSLFATGFVLRYAPLYRKAKEILDSGKLGRVISIDANENISPNHGAYIMTNWRRDKSIAGPHILEKCVHDFDLLNWLTGSVPVRIAAFGGNDMWIPENADCMPREIYCGWLSCKGANCDQDNPFTSDKTIEDNVVAIMEYANGVRAQFQATMSNSIPERRMYFHCTRGNLVLELYTATLRYRAVDEEAEQVIVLKGDLHGGGDSRIMAELADSMKTGALPKCGGREGLLSAVVGLTIDQARVEGKVIDLSPTWKKLGCHPQEGPQA